MQSSLDVVRGSPPPQMWTMPFRFQSWFSYLLIKSSRLMFMVLYIPGGCLNFLHQQHLLIAWRSKGFFNETRLDYQDAGCFQSWCPGHRKYPTPRKNQKINSDPPRGCTFRQGSKKWSSRMKGIWWKFGGFSLGKNRNPMIWLNCESKMGDSPPLTPFLTLGVIELYSGFPWIILTKIDGLIMSKN